MIILERINALEQNVVDTRNELVSISDYMNTVEQLNLQNNRLTELEGTINDPYHYESMLRQVLRNNGSSDNIMNRFVEWMREHSTNEFS